ncbi:MAG TPA: ATP-binding cassette domain-containing protein [Myxococcaceae bacterium]|jgi:polar amino acid transport system ATP-binding protein/sulfate transport system ATP-binding protein
MNALNVNAMNAVRKEVLLRADGVSLDLGGHPILRDVSLEIRDLVRPGAVTGQVVGLLGPSGMGKTQLLRILAGLTAPTSGSVRLTPEQVPVRPGLVGVVSQDCALFEHRTVLGNLCVAGRQAGLSSAAARSKARGLLERLGLADKEALYPGQLSGGERQRVAIAQQLMCSDHYLLMDEPFSGLDPLAQAEVCRVITEVASQHELNTIVVITHDIRAAIEVADELWLLGRDRDGDGRPIEGARIQATYDLVARGLTWHPDIAHAPGLAPLVEEIRGRFAQL